ncbi:MAG: hypothetical protein QXV51_01265 [Thermosphaera sp.]
MATELFMASGRVVSSYQLLLEYYKLCKEYTGQQCDPIPSTDDLKELEALLKSGDELTLSDIMDYFEKKYVGKISEIPARDACRIYFKIEVSQEYCKREIARLVSGWLIEIAENLGMLRLKPLWKNIGDFVEK